MAIMAGPIIEGFGSLAAGGLNYLGQREANRMNQKISREQMSFQREATREQMGFQERMSNTAYQRSMVDMKAAGLNPILAAGGGASSPSGSSAPGSSSHMANEFAGAVSSALDFKRMMAEVANLRTQNKLLESQVPGAENKAMLDQSKWAIPLLLFERIMSSLKGVKELIDVKDFIKNRG